MADSTPLKFDVVIAGGGFAGVYCAQALGKEFEDATPKHVALISDQNFMTFQPMLAEVVGSTISPRHVVNPIRRLCNATVFRGAISSIDPQTRRITLMPGEYTQSIQLEYEHLVLAVGGIVDLSRVPGMAEHAYLMKNVGDALVLRGAIIDRFEEANLQSNLEDQRRSLTFVIVGGGYSGVETAGQILDLAKEMLGAYPRIPDEALRVVLVHSGPHLLPEINESLGHYCEDNLRARGIELILNSRVAAVTASQAKLLDGREIESHTVVCTVGNAPHPLLGEVCRSANLACEKGRLITEPTLRVPGNDRIWAAGDCAAVPMWTGEPGNRTATDSKISPYAPRPYCPPTAQFATRQAELLARNLALSLRNPAAALKPFTFTGLGELAAIGHHAAVAEIMGMKFSGFFAWWLWRSIYLMKLPGIERKVRVVLDWTLDLFFPRDIALFQSRPTRLMKKMHLEPGDALLKAGDPARSLYVIQSGKIEIRDGDHKVLRTLGAGDHIGKNTILHGKVWPFNAVAAEPTELVTVSAAVFEAIAGAGAEPEHVFARPEADAAETRKVLAAGVPG